MREAISFVMQTTHSLTSSVTSYKVFANVLQSCASILDISLGKALHSHVIKQGHNSCQSVVKALLNMYAKCKTFEDCQKLFDEIKFRDTVIWNILLSGFAGSKNHDNKVMELFNVLRAIQDPKPSPVTLAIVLPVFTRTGVLGAGMSMHAYVIKSGMESQTLVGNALVSMYAKCRIVLDASAVFDGIADKDVVSYNALIAGFAENKLVSEAFQIFSQMIEVPLMPNYATIANILPLCVSLGGMVSHKIGKEIHGYVLRRTELEEEITVINALLSFYLRMGITKNAESLFRKMKVRDLVSWNSVIAGYASNGEWSKALLAFRKFVDMKMIDLDSVTLISVLPASAQLRNLQVGKELHGYVFRHRALFEDTSVGNALISFYSKCGYTEAAYGTFLLIPQRDLISWNTLLDAFGGNLLETKFFSLLHWMFVDGIKADAVTVLTIVQLCATVSKIKYIKETHGFALRFGLLFNDSEPTLLNALLDAYAKCGNIECSFKIFSNFYGKCNVVTYNSMISGYLSTGSHEGATNIFRSMVEKDLTTWNLMIRGHALNECPMEALNFFHELQDLGRKPDAMTIMSILPVCGQMASVHLLKQCHGYSVRACFNDVHLIAALLDVYSKSGSISSAYKLYLSIPGKDLVLFTAMLGGYAMHGMGQESIQVFHQMLDCGLKPDHVVITAVLSACRHSGLISEGLMIFNSIENEHNMKPSMEQYACVVDLLARGGRIKEAFSFIKQMPLEANANIWGTLLGACKTHHDVDMGHLVAEKLKEIETSDIGNFVVISNLYAADARWDWVLEMRKMMKSRDLKKPAGCSWIEVGNCNNVFVAGDCSHPDRSFIYNMLINLDTQIKELYTPPHI